MDKKQKVYFAGSLFSSKDIIGNKMISNAIVNLTDKYELVLPQDIESCNLHPKEIRDNDIKTLLSCDMAIFNFDGSELDSGTVAEFMLAKFASMPSLLLRTDFRSAGDQKFDDSILEPWNLMLSFYPQTLSLIINAASVYKQCFESEVPNLTKYSESIASLIIEKLDKLVSLKTSNESKDDINSFIGKIAGL